MTEITLSESVIKAILKDLNNANDTIYYEWNNGDEGLGRWIDYFDAVLEGKGAVIIILEGDEA